MQFVVCGTFDRGPTVLGASSPIVSLTLAQWSFTSFVNGVWRGGFDYQCRRNRTTTRRPRAKHLVWYTGRFRRYDYCSFLAHGGGQQVLPIVVHAVLSCVRWPVHHRPRLNKKFMWIHCRERLPHEEVFCSVHPRLPFPKRAAGHPRHQWRALGDQRKCSWSSCWGSPVY